MAWIELHQGLREHRKVFACAELLNISRVTMLGTLASLWLWALDNAQTGSLAGVSVKTLARVCDWPEKKAQKLVDALHQTGWLDHDGDSYRIHDWLDYAGRLVERREKEAKRKQEARNQRKTGAGCPQDVRRMSAGHPQDVPGMSAESPALPPPQPYHNHNHNISGDGGEYRARDTAPVSLDQIGVAPGDYLFPIPSEVVRQVLSTSADLFSRLADRSPSVQDHRNVFEFISRFNPSCGVYLDRDATDLLRYAFQQAANAGKHGNWRYITGVMNRLSARNITTAEQAADYDEARTGGEV